MRKNLMILVLVLLICLSGCVVLMPTVYASETGLHQEGLTILDNILGLNLTEYNITYDAVYTPKLYHDAVPMEKIRYRFESPSSTIDALYTFVNGQPQLLHILENKGTPHLTLPTFGTLEMTKNILNKYAEYSKNPIYTQLLTLINEAQNNKNTTITSENIKLEITTTDSTSTFRWTYIANAVEAPDKCVVLHYKDDFLGYFIDNWTLYNVGSVDINLSEEQAIEIALNAAHEFSWTVGTDENVFEVNNFNVTQAMIKDTFFTSSLYVENVRSGDLLELYPVWHVWVSLDKFYPGNVYGIEVYIWADTGEICYIHERFSTLDPPEELVANIDDVLGVPHQTQLASSNMLVLLSIVVVSMFGSVSMFLLKKRNFVRHQFFKIRGVFICLLLLATLFLSVSEASAYPTRRAIIWGSESAGAPLNNQGLNTRKTTAELNLQYKVSCFIYNSFWADGYVTSNYQGAGSSKTQILNNITDSQQYYSKTAYIDFDHGVGNPLNDSIANWPIVGMDEFHYMFEDNVGTVGSGDIIQNGVYDYEIFPRTGNGNAFFTLINACMSASIADENSTLGQEYDLTQPQGILYNDQWVYTGRARGMPFAWTHRTVNWKGNLGFNTNDHMSMFGYESGSTGADDGAFCYIGFPYGSAALDLTIQPNSQVKYWKWLWDFFVFALEIDLTVNQALDEASLYSFNMNFGATELYTGFDAVWPMWNYSIDDWDLEPYSGSTMAVYGNGNIYLHEYFVSLVYNASSSGLGSVTDAKFLEGFESDGYYARLRAVNVNDKASVKGRLVYWVGDQPTGHIWAYGYSSGYISRLRVYVSDDLNTWYTVNNNVLVMPGGAYWIDCGNFANTFKYIQFEVYRESSSDYSNDIYIDNVLIIPPTP